MTDIQYRMLIDGELVAAENGRAYENINPANEEVLGTAPDATAADIERAVLAARRAFDTTDWATDVELRRKCLEQLQSGLRKHSDTLRDIVVAEAGSPISMTYRVQVDGAIEFITHYLDLLDRYEFERELPTDPTGRDVLLVRREAVGVVAAITPWNVPLYLAIAKVAAALAAGCTVVLKPAPDTPWHALLLGEIAREHTDIPAGVLNVVTTADNEVASLLTSHPAVDSVSFTGSTATGRRIMAAAAPTVKRVTLELGGKSAGILLDDADFQKIIPGIVGGCCSHAGQGCAIQTRLLVPRSRHDEAVALAAAVMGHIKWGDPTDPENIMGPVANARQFDTVQKYYALAADTGRIVVGGKVSDRFDKGYWVEPTLVTDLDPLSPVAQEEVFGPLLAVLPFDDDDDAVRIADNTIFGLSGGVHSQDLDRAMAVARRLRTGTVGVNGGNWFNTNAPFGGYKQSGIGREWGTEGLEDFLEVKTIAHPRPAV